MKAYNTGFHSVRLIAAQLAEDAYWERVCAEEQVRQIHEEISSLELAIMDLEQELWERLNASAIDAYESQLS
jgi:hypothetical protein